MNKTIKFIKQNYTGYVFIMPIVLGVVLFTLIPMLSSFYYSFFDYNMISEPKNFGVHNYVNAFSDNWGVTAHALKVTAVFSVVSVPLYLTLSFLVALLVSKNIKGIKLYRVAYYIPLVIPAIVGGLLWRDMFDFKYGFVNRIVNLLGFESFRFFTDAKTAMPTLIFLGFFGLGGNMVLWLAALKNVPSGLYESAQIDGAGPLRRLFNITVPMCTPMIFYNLLMGIIGSLQTFSSVYILTAGTAGTDRALFFYLMYIYGQAFSAFNMGYACALSWILFAIIAVLTYFVFKTSKWVFYGEDYG